MPSVVVPACRRTVRSPLAPSSRRPHLAIASAWSGHSVTAWTSWPWLAISAAYTEPMAPQPMIVTLAIDASPVMQSLVLQRRRHAAGDRPGATRSFTAAAAR